MPHDMLADLKAILMDTAKSKYGGQNTVYFRMTFIIFFNKNLSSQDFEGISGY
jgi:hypothetical protein